jgi:hypothetical protein
VRIILDCTIGQHAERQAEHLFQTQTTALLIEMDELINLDMIIADADF